MEDKALTNTEQNLIIKNINIQNSVKVLNGFTFRSKKDDISFFQESINIKTFDNYFLFKGIELLPQTLMFKSLYPCSLMP